MLSINSISFAYNKINVIDSINFVALKGEHIAVMGESGCGKSTLLKAIYGLLLLQKGEIVYKNEILLSPEHHLVPGYPFMKYLAQEFDLMPFISAAENVGEFLSNFYPKKKKQRIAELLKVVGMTKYATTHVRYLSGGQKQRIALARVLAKEPEVLLLDEPFSQIDNFKKNELRYQLFDYLKKQKITCITATHDKNDVLSFANRVLILKDGKQLCLKNVKKIYNNPKDIYTASLLSKVNSISVNHFIPEIKNKKLLLYPHEIKVTAKSNLSVIVSKVFYKGSHYLVKATLGNKTLFFITNTNLKEGKKVYIKVRKTIIEQRVNN